MACCDNGGGQYGLRFGCDAARIGDRVAGRDCLLILGGLIFLVMVLAT